MFESYMLWLEEVGIYDFQKVIFIWYCLTSSTLTQCLATEPLATLSCPLLVRKHLKEFSRAGESGQKLGRDFPVRRYGLDWEEEKDHSCTQDCANENLKKKTNRHFHIKKHFLPQKILFYLEISTQDTVNHNPEKHYHKEIVKLNFPDRIVLSVSYISLDNTCKKVK